MHEKIKQIITASYHPLSDRITLDEKLWNLLGKYADNMITNVTKQDIQTKGCNYNQVTALLTYLQRRTNNDFVNFCKSLVAAELEFVVEEYLIDALRYAGTSLEDIKREVKKQSVSSQHPRHALYSRDVLDLNVTDSAYKVNVTNSTKEFYNDHKEQAYSVEPKNRGYAIIINVKHVPGHDAREGTDIDRNKIKDLLDALEFESITTFNDLDAQEIMQKVKGFIESVSKEAKRVALFFLSHGGPGTILGTDGGTVKIDDLMQCLSSENAPDLAGIPKMMVFQACRGTMSTVAPDALLIDDLVVCFPTQEGYLSWRDKKTGSYFIAAIVQVFEKQAHCDDIVGMMKKVAEQVHEEAKKKIGSEIYQFPDIQHKLTKDLYFFPGHPEFN